MYFLLNKCLNFIDAMSVNKAIDVRYVIYNGNQFFLSCIDIYN